MNRLDSLGPYRITERLDAGGVTETYKAYGAAGRPVAICLLHPIDTKAEAQACRMAEAASRIRHPYVEQVLGWQKLPQGICVISEFLPGVSLRTLVSMYGPLSCARLALFGSQIAEGLAEIHAHGLVHEACRAGYGQPTRRRRHDF
jgi:serine/threonine protein kinase